MARKGARKAPKNSDGASRPPAPRHQAEQDPGGGRTPAAVKERGARAGEGPGAEPAAPAALAESAPQAGTSAPRDRFPIVALGASAGGLEALETFFEKTPEGCGMAFVVITHTDPDHASMLPEIIRRKARIAVQEIRNGMPAEPETIYLPPSDSDPALDQGVFRLRKRPARSHLHLPVDLFLKNLAAERGESAGCVILSGTGTDGTQGVRLIKEKGGVAAVQSLDSARHSGMPESALSTGLIDFVLPPDRLPERLMEYFENPTPATFALEGGKSEKADTLRKILLFLGSRTRHDFTLYKTSTMARRIERRMTVTRSRSPEGYLKYLHRNPDETRALLQDLLIGVTSFFRDPEAFDFLRQSVVPQLIDRTPESAMLRVWVAGCATGEEAYSVAIVFKECLEQSGRHHPLQFFGTDIDAKAIDKARQGIYLPNIAAEVSPERLRRFFIREGESYRVRGEIRESLVFAEQNLLRDPPFSGLDMLVCRNLLIYLRPEAQEKLLPLFHYTLKRGGILFLGTSESVGRFPELFQPLSKPHSIYQRKESLVRPQVLFPTGAREPRPAEGEEKQREAPRRGEPFNISQAADRILLREYTPACVIVNAAGEIVHVHGRTGKYLEPAQGKPTLRIADMAREGLRFALLSALRRCEEQGRPVHESGVLVKTNGGHQRIALTVKPMTQEPLKGSLMVLFEDIEPLQAGGKPEAEAPPEDQSQQRIEELERELMRLRHDYQGAMEELETSNEELRSVNEEMHSSNEELQSTNEELESSREELQSLNEELNTVNSELHSKIAELNDAYSAVAQVLNATRIAIVFLDTELRVRRFTSEASRLINLIDSDVGRPLQHIATNLTSKDLSQKALQVLERLTPWEEEVRTTDGRWYRMAIMVHRSQEHVIEGVVLTFINIDPQKQEQGQGADGPAEALAAELIELPGEALLLLDRELRVRLANRRFYERCGLAPEQAAGRPLTQLEGGAWNPPGLREMLAQAAQRSREDGEFSIEQELEPGGGRRLRVRGRRLRGADAPQDRILLRLDEAPSTGKEMR